METLVPHQSSRNRRLASAETAMNDLAEMHAKKTSDSYQ
jgi:hypothetical protein